MLFFCSCSGRFRVRPERVQSHTGSVAYGVSAYRCSDGFTVDNLGQCLDQISRGEVDACECVALRSELNEYALCFETGSRLEVDVVLGVFENGFDSFACGVVDVV